MANWISIDHSLLSPNGRMSKRARAAAIKREAGRLFPAGYWDEANKVEQPSNEVRADRLVEMAKLTSPRQAKKLLAEAEKLRGIK